MQLAILMANTDESTFADRHPKDGEKWRALLSPMCPDCKFSVYSVKDGEFPDRPLTDFDGLIVTGSPASVLEGAAWLDQLAQTIRQAEADKVPMFGACFGHQAIALALGGSVGKNADDWVFGVTETEIHSPAPWMDAGKGPILLNAAHEEQVTSLPANARVNMGNQDCPYGGFTIGDHVFTTQYHPEITPDFMAALIDELADTKPPDVIENARDSLTLQPENHRFSRWIMQFFSGKKKLS
jgi:GMP synthase-like glutamine amidotransferase